MKSFLKVFLIFAFCLLLSSCFAQENDLILKTNTYYSPTQADMLEYSHKELDKITNKYNEICDKLIKNFYKDKEFVQALKKNQILYLQYRQSERNIVLPKGNIEYGSNYGINSDSVLIESTKNQIKSLRKLVEKYCLYNDFYNDKNACNTKTLDKIFK